MIRTLLYTHTYELPGNLALVWKSYQGSSHIGAHLLLECTAAADPHSLHASWACLTSTIAVVPACIYVPCIKDH